MFQSILDFLKDFGALGLFIHAMIDAIIFPIPAFFLQVSLSLINPSSALWLATVGFIGCLLGTPVGYYIGRGLGHSVLYKLLKKEWVDKATAMFQKNGETAILIGSFTPIPFKVFTILSGCLKFPLWRLIIFAALGRAIKFYVVGALFYIFGRAAEGMVKDVSLYIFLIAVPILVIFLFIRSKIRKKRLARQTEAETGAQGGAEEAAKSEAAADAVGSAVPEAIVDAANAAAAETVQEAAAETVNESESVKESDAGTAKVEDGKAKGGALSEKLALKAKTLPHQSKSSSGETI